MMKQIKIINKLKKFNFKKINIKWALPLLALALGFWAYNRYGVVAKVNGRNISRIDYIKAMEKQVGKQTLDQMIVESLVEQEALKKGVKIEKSEIDSDIKKIEEQIKSQGQTLESALASEGMNLKDLEKQIKIEKMVEKLSDPKTEITEAQIKDFLTKNKAQLPKGATQTELNDLAKKQLESQIKSEAASNWFSNLKKEAKIIYR